MIDQAIVLTRRARGAGRCFAALAARWPCSWPRWRRPATRGVRQPARAELAAGAPIRSERVCEAAGAFAEAAPGRSRSPCWTPTAGRGDSTSTTQFSSASVSKALLLAAELRRLQRAGRAARRGHALAAGADDHLLRQRRRQRHLRAGRRRRACAEIAQRAGMRSFERRPRLLGRRPGDGRRPRPLLLRPRPQPAGAPPRLRQAAARRTSPARSAGASPRPPAASGRVYFKGGWRPAGTERDERPRHPPGRPARASLRTTDRDRGAHRPVAGHDQLRTLEGITRRLLAEPTSAAALARALSCPLASGQLLLALTGTRGRRVPRLPRARRRRRS